MSIIYLYGYFDCKEHAVIYSLQYRYSEKSISIDKHYLTSRGV